MPLPSPGVDFITAKFDSPRNPSTRGCLANPTTAFSSPRFRVAENRKTGTLARFPVARRRTGVPVVPQNSGLTQHCRWHRSSNRHPERLASIKSVKSHLPIDLRSVDAQISLDIARFLRHHEVLPPAVGISLTFHVGPGFFSHESPFVLCGI